MDLITLALANEYTDEQRLGWEDWETVALGPNEQKANPFDTPIGLRVMDTLPGLRILVTPPGRPEMELTEGNNICNSDTLFVGYHTLNGILSKAAIFVACPNMGSYDFQEGWAFVYAFEETSDTMGLGLTIQQGWYAINSNTFQIVPITLEEYPVLIAPDQVKDGILPGCEEYMDALFPRMDTYEYTVAERNMIDMGDGLYWIAPANVQDIGSEDSFLISLFVPSFVWGPEAVQNNSTCQMEISQRIVHKIDPKFIPETGGTGDHG